MSSIAVNAITDANAGNTATINAVTPNVNNVLGKNRIINGNMVIDQRNAGASVTPTDGQYSLDRFASKLSQPSKFSVQQNAGSVTPPIGFTKYLGITSLSAYSVGVSDYFYLEHRIEGQNVSDLGWGTASAKSVTLSFQVYSSLTGTFGGSLFNASANYSYPYTYTITSANTWTTINITIQGPTAGTWLTTNGIGIFITFGLGVGASASGTAGVWAGSLFRSATGATSVVGTSGATFYITGVQLEAGSSATEFEHRPYTTELQLCQRYFLLISSGLNKPIGLGAMYSATFLASVVSFPVTMRTDPTIYQVTGTNHFIFFRNSNSDPFDSFTLNTTNPYGFEIFNNTQISGVVGHSGFIRSNNAAAVFGAQAEL